MEMTHPVLIAFWTIGAVMMLPLVVKSIRGDSFRPAAKWAAIPGFIVLLFAAGITFGPEKLTWVLMAENMAGENLEGGRLIKKGEELPSLGACRSRCAVEPKCEAYTYTVYPNGSHHCILLREANMWSRTREGTSSGRKRTWAQPLD